LPNILLIDTNISPMNEARPIYPISLDYLQGVLKKAGFRGSEILDLRSAGGNLDNHYQRHERSLGLITRKLRERAWDVIGIGIRNVDSTLPCVPEHVEQDYYLPQIKSYIDCIRSGGNLQPRIVLGGSGFSLMPDEILEYMGGDCYGVAGPGEAAFPQLITDLLDNKVTRRVYQAATTGFPRLQNLDLLRKYRYYLPQNISTVGVRTTNGCGQHCSYCSYPLISGAKITTRNVSDVLDEIRTLMEIGFDSFMFADDVFNASLEHAKQILKGMLNMGVLPKSWYAYLNIKNTDEELLELILGTNGYSYYPGGNRQVNLPFDIDSGCDRILAGIDKSFTTEDIRRTMVVFEKVRKHHERHQQISCIKSELHLLLGHPGEDEDSIQETCQFVNEIRPDSLSFQIGVRVYPQTALARETKNKLWSEPKDLLEPVFVPHCRTQIESWLFEFLEPKYHVRREYNSIDNTTRLPFITAVLEKQDRAVTRLKDSGYNCEGLC
jgi:radical SAM superfamily enzyme YgiQ (UPF0313 family)